MSSSSEGAVDGGKLLVDLAKLGADALAGQGPLVLVGDVAALLYDQVGGAKLRAIGLYLIEHANMREPTPERVLEHREEHG